MNRLQYLLTATDLYALQSTFVYHLYQEALFARLPRRRCRELQLHTKEEQLCYRLANYLHPVAVTLYEPSSALRQAILKGCPGCQVAVLAESQSPNPSYPSFLLMRRPHQDSTREVQWTHLQSLHPQAVVIDLYYMGIVLYRHGIAPQKFLLR